MDANLTGLFLFNFESTSCKNHSDTIFFFFFWGGGGGLAQEQGDKAGVQGKERDGQGSLSNDSHK